MLETQIGEFPKFQPKNDTTTKKVLAIQTLINTKNHGLMLQQLDEIIHRNSSIVARKNFIQTGSLPQRNDDSSSFFNKHILRGLQELGSKFIKTTLKKTNISG